MADLPQNQTYANANQAMSSMVNKLSSIGRTLSQAKRKSADTTKYTGLVNNVKSNLGPIGPETVSYGGSTKFENKHLATDYGAPIGTPVPAYASGKVVDERTGMVQGSPDFGNYIIVETPDGKQFRYSHLSKTYIPVGSTVQRGEIIGAAGNSGQTYSNSGGSGSHLDLRIYDIYQKNFVNPSKYVNS